MQYPLISEYVDAIRSAEDNLDKLRDLRPVFDSNGTPIMSSGNFAVVFKMKDVRTGRMYAVKCFTREQEGREEAYRQIADELEFVQSSYLAKVRYYDHELFVDTNSSDDSEFPVLLMDWVEGETLDRYVRRNINDTYALEMLAYNFSRLAMWLLPQPFAHGDLKPDNILVQDDGSLTLVDYDGMYVPAMQGQKSRELGSPDFRHPLRTDADFNEHIDDFPAISILLSLRLIAADPSLLDSYGASDRLLFAESDYRDLSSCALLKEVFPSQNSDINSLVCLFTIADIHKSLSHVSFRLLAVRKPQRPEKIEIKKEKLSTKVTKEDLANAVEDGFGAKYSKDGKRLLKVPNNINEYKYKIKNGTKVICNGAFFLHPYLQEISIPASVTAIGYSAFSGCSSLQEISIPASVTAIGYSAFFGCYSLQEISIPASVTAIGDSAFSGCKSLQEIVLPEKLKIIGTNPFKRCRCKITSKSPHFIVKDNVLYNADMSTLISYLSEQTEFAIPTGVTTIGNWAFFGCSSLQEISIPASVTAIGDSAFGDCSSLKRISIPASVTAIGNEAFLGCKSLQEISIPESVTAIGDSAFGNCSSLKRISIPASVTAIGDNAFYGCKSLQEISIPASVTAIGDNAFYGCKSLQEISIPASVTAIGDNAFYGCKSLQGISLSTGITAIGDSAFSGCSSLQEISIPKSVTAIGDSAFSGCSSLQEISIPKSVTAIGDSAFSGCSSLQEISIPKSVTAIGQSAFYECKSLQEISIPASVTTIGNLAFSFCPSLQNISIPTSVTTIGYSAFSWCTSLKEIVLPEKLKIIGTNPFIECRCKISSKSPHFIVKDNVLYNADMSTLISYLSEQTKFDIPTGVTAVGQSAFYECKSLQEISIPASVTTIGNLAFSWCKSLKEIKIPKGSRTKFEKLLPNYKDKLVEV